MGLVISIILTFPSYFTDIPFKSKINWHYHNINLNVSYKRHPNVLEKFKIRLEKIFHEILRLIDLMTQDNKIKRENLHVYFRVERLVSRDIFI